MPKVLFSVLSLAVVFLMTAEVSRADFSGNDVGFIQNIPDDDDSCSCGGGVIDSPSIPPDTFGWNLNLIHLPNTSAMNTDLLTPPVLYDQTLSLGDTPILRGPPQQDIGDPGQSEYPPTGGGDVPEPATLILWGLGTLVAAGFGCYRHRQYNRERKMLLIDKVS
jgi:hypothetical protein